MGEVESKISRMTSTYSTIDDAILAQSEKVQLLILIHQTHSSPEFSLERAIVIERQALIELKKLKESTSKPDPPKPAKLTWQGWIRKKLINF